MSFPRVVYDGDRFVVVNPDSEYCGFYGELSYLDFDPDGRIGIRLDPDPMRSRWEIAFHPDELELVSRQAEPEPEFSSDICGACESPGEPRPGFDMNPAVVSVLCDACYEALGKIPLIRKVCAHCGRVFMAQPSAEPQLRRAVYCNHGCQRATEGRASIYSFATGEGIPLPGVALN
jgi:hypothetical protein